MVELSAAFDTVDYARATLASWVEKKHLSGQKHCFEAVEFESSGKSGF